jgi:putative methyltransferase (TIGR04325 family)
VTLSVADLLAAGRLQEAEWLMRRGASTPLSIGELAERLHTQLSPESFFVSPGYYAPLPNWAEAERCCGDAYQASSVVERYRRQLPSKPSQLIGAYTIRQLAALQHAWLELGQPSQLRVLDFGGALGSHFHALEPFWPWCRLQWTVCETTAVATAGNAEFECDRPNGTTLRFTDQAAEVVNAGIDLVFASCSLQYLEDWQPMLQLFKATPWLLLDRVPLIDHPSDLIAIQVVPASYTDTRYPGWKWAASTWLPRLQQAGFKPVLQWLVPEDRWTILDLDTGKLRWSAQHDHGFLLRSSSTLTFF